MTYEEFNEFCGRFPGTTHVLQWGEAHVWKVSGEVFSVGGWSADEPSFSFRASDIDYDDLRRLPGLRPAPFFAWFGLKWIQHHAGPGLSDVDLRKHIQRSYELAAARSAKVTDPDQVCWPCDHQHGVPERGGQTVR